MRKRNEKGQFSKTKVSEFGFVNLSTYTSPEVKEVNGADWIEYGADNNYFQFLIDRYNGSPTNNAAINGISQAIYGKGLNATDSNRKPNEYAQMVSLFKKDVVRRACYDLKLMGQAAIQVIYSKDRSKIVQLEHMPIETLRAEKCNEDGEVPAYYYFNDWANIKKTDEPLRIPAFGMSNEEIEIYYIKPYKSGFYYYSPVDYQGGLQYAELEEEVSNYHLNNIMNGLSPSMLINFNNGTPNQQERQLIETKIAQKFSGTSNAGKFILAFNDNKESQAEITPVQLSDAHNQYQFLSEESTSKIMVAHRIVSPMLLGIKDGSGLGNNAEEIKTASLLMDNTVIRPFQELLIDSFDNILAYNEISLNLYFTTLQPLEFTEVDQTLQDKETIEEETGVEMSADEPSFLSDEMGVDAAEISFDDERFRAEGSNLTPTMLEVADMARAAGRIDLLEHEEHVKLEARSFPNGVHICEVVIDPDTGVVTTDRYFVVDDFGNLINPMLAEGQVHGGVVQGIGQALTEHVVYDEDGQLLTATFMDYAMPRADDVPRISFTSVPVPSTANVMGMKGCGEAGTVGALAAVANAVQDALWDRRIRQADMPFTPHKVWKLLRDASDFTK